MDFIHTDVGYHDLYSLIIDFQPNNIQHILNTNLILLTIKAAHQIYREKTDIISKNNNIDRRELNKLLFKARRKIYIAALSHEIHSGAFHCEFGYLGIHMRETPPHHLGYHSGYPRFPILTKLVLFIAKKIPKSAKKYAPTPRLPRHPNSQ